MNRQKLIAVAIVASSLLTAPAIYASPVSIHVPVNAMFSNKAKTVKISLRNDSNAVIELKVDDKVMSLEVGKTVTFKLPVGTRVLANNTTPNHPAGSLIEQISTDYDGATISIH
jgi:hypothetical protein